MLWRKPTLSCLSSGARLLLPPPVFHTGGCFAFYIKLVQIIWIQLLSSAAPFLLPFSYLHCSTQLTDWQLKPQWGSNPPSYIELGHRQKMKTIHTLCPEPLFFLTCCCAQAQNPKISFTSLQHGSHVRGRVNHCESAEKQIRRLLWGLKTGSSPSESCPFSFLLLVCCVLFSTVSVCSASSSGD